MFLCLGLYLFENRIDFIRAVNNAYYDQLLTSYHTEVQSGSVAIIDLDEASLEQFGQWPWPRYRIADLTQKIIDAGARVVVFDIVFPEEDRTSPKSILNDIEDRFGVKGEIQNLPPELLDFDDIFAKTLASHPTVLGSHLHMNQSANAKVVKSNHKSYKDRVILKGLYKGARRPALLNADKITVSIPKLADACGNIAFFNSDADYKVDDQLRVVPLILALGKDRIYPSLALEGVRLFHGQEKIIVEYDEISFKKLRVGPCEIDIGDYGCIGVNYRSIQGENEGTEFSFQPSFSASSLMKGELDPRNLQDRIVFVGTSAPGLKDLKATPLSHKFSGVEVQATIADNILAGDNITNLPYSKVIQIFSIIFICFVTILINGRCTALRSSLITVLIVTALIAASVHLFTAYHIRYIPLHEILALVAIYTFISLISFWEQEKQTRWIRNVFGSMVSPQVLKKLEEQSTELHSLSSKEEAHIMFVDLKSFTEISERLTPDQTSSLLKQFLSTTSNIVLEEEGAVDKFIGDAVMAVWGVPFKVKNPAIRTCETALKIKEAVEGLKEKMKTDFDYDIDMRIGINSGEVIAGNFGSETKYQYTVIGDTVNVAARLEPLNKKYNTKILIGEETKSQLDDQFVVRKIAKVTVKGKIDEVQVYELLARNFAELGERASAIKKYINATTLVEQGQHDAAITELEEAQKLDPQDTPTKILLEKLNMRQQLATV